MMVDIDILEDVRTKLPNVRLGVLEIGVVVEPSDNELLGLMQERIDALSKSMKTEEVGEIGTVKSSKEAYRLLGKDPSRYRLSADSLLRRVVKGHGLYYVNNVVDILNYQSITTGYSICGFDAKCIHGKVVLGLGEKEEAYVGIGRGNINVENMPIFRDDFGPFGTPTSDSTRTAVGKKTTSFLMIYVAFDGGVGLEKILDDTQTLLEKYCSATNGSKRILK